ncbi:Phage lysozyme [Cohaesibacter marisflavi]|uniref:Phage lysozyme n=1 Tax=Cohaesibacter marisflavi TaxID=655353 RepID=A0A1I5E307_9HYPH|nr:glycoside hydrolase family protein [Cohaesibacter marisflavi]SFO05862.1 Phage lysozyme [Cohaesibacter marisflavi]
MKLQKVNAGRRLDTGAGTMPRISNSPMLAQGINRAVDAVADFSTLYEKQQAKLMGFKAQQGFVKLGNNLNMSMLQAEQTMPSDGGKFADERLADFGEQSKKFLDTLPPAMQAAYAPKLEALRGDVAEKASRKQFARRNQFYIDGISDMADRLKNGVLQNPDSYEETESLLASSINQTGLPDWKKSEALKNVRKVLRGQALQGLALAGRVEDARTLAKQWDAEDTTIGNGSVTATELPGEAQRLLSVISAPGIEGADYNTLYGGGSFDGYGDHPRKSIPIDSGRNAGKTSSAAGRYQFLAGTWDEAAKALGLKDFSPENQDRAAWWLAQRDYKARTGGDLLADLEAGAYDKVRAGLGGSGNDTTWEGLQKISDASFANAMNAASAVGAGDGGQIVTDGVGLHKAEGAPVLADPASGMGQWGQLTEKAISAADSQKTKEGLTRFNALDLKVANGDVVSLEDINADKVMTENQKATLIRRVKADTKKQIALNATAERLKTNPESFNPFLSEDQKAIDDLYKYQTKASGGMSSSDEETRKASMAFVLSLADQQGIVPKGAIAEMRQMLVSDDASKVRNGLEIAAFIAKDHAVELKARDGGSPLAQAGREYDYYVNHLGMTPEKATARYMQRLTPEFQRERDRREKLLNGKTGYLATLGKKEVASAFGGFFGNPDVGFTEGQRLSIESDYKDAVTEHFLDTGDWELSQYLAKQDLVGPTGLYGVTEINGSKAVMRFPPEKVYAQFIAHGGSIEEVAEQAASDASEVFGTDIKREDIGFVVDSEAEAEIRAGKPKYRLVVRLKGKDGQDYIQTTPAYFQFDEKAALEKRRQNRREALKEDPQENEDDLIGREKSLDRYLDGPIALPTEAIEDLPSGPAERGASRNRHERRQKQLDRADAKRLEKEAKRLEEDEKRARLLSEYEQRRKQ